LVLSSITVFFVFLIPENLIPQIYARFILGIIFVLFFPGYVATKTLYPIGVPLKTPSIALDTIERIVLSVGLSLVVTPMVGLILYNTPWGLSLASATISLLAVTAVFASVGILREYLEQKSLFLRKVITITEFEVTNNILRFFDEQGLMKRRRVVVKEISLAEITNIDSRGCELSVTSGGVANIFIMRRAESITDLRDRVRGMIVGGSK
jgi:uncharacterized membrane protein